MVEQNTDNWKITSSDFLKMKTEFKILQCPLGRA